MKAWLQSRFQVGEKTILPEGGAGQKWGDVVSVGFYKKLWFSLQQRVSQNTFPIWTTSITAKALVITKHFDFPAAEEDLKSTSDLISETCKKAAASWQKGLQCHLFRLILFLHSKKISIQTLFPRLWHCWKRWRFCWSVSSKVSEFWFCDCAVLKKSGKKIDFVRLLLLDFVIQ